MTLQVLALVFIRKLMDLFFTKREMSWLDDLMPESRKKKLEDAEEEVTLGVGRACVCVCVCVGGGGGGG